MQHLKQLLSGVIRHLNSTDNATYVYYRIDFSKFCPV